MGDTELSKSVVSQLMKLVSNEIVNMLTTWPPSARLVHRKLQRIASQTVQAAAKAAVKRILSQSADPRRFETDNAPGPWRG